MVVGVTGHRPNKLGNDYSYSSQLSQAIFWKFVEMLKSLKATSGVTGMALGVDQIFAYACIHSNVPYTAAVPFKGQANVWPGPSKDRYYYLLSKANNVVCTSDSPKYSASLMQKRNVYMIDKLVDHMRHLLAVWNGSPGGTYNCIDYASKRLPSESITMINPSTLVKHSLDYISIPVSSDEPYLDFVKEYS